MIFVHLQSIGQIDITKINLFIYGRGQPMVAHPFNGSISWRGA